MIKCKTLCVNCKHHTGSGLWYNHRCEHPDEARIPEQDPITGKRMYSILNDFDDAHLSDDKFPGCRGLNRGNCPNFEKKGRFNVFSRRADYPKPHSEDLYD